MNDERDSAANRCLAHACKAAGAACCKKGKIFLPPDEEARVRQWVADHAPEMQDAFEARLGRRDGFSLLDQGDACLFLDPDNLCRLHADGAKPSECFWWPMHVYATAPDGTLEIRVSTSCCAAHQHVDAGGEAVSGLRARARAIGHGLLRAFRRAYPGSYDTRPLAPLGEADEP